MTKSGIFYVQNKTKRSIIFRENNLHSSISLTEDSALHKRKLNL